MTNEIDRIVIQVAQGITIAPDVMSGQPCIAGTRITPKSVSDLAKAGYDVAGIQDEYPTLSAAQIACALVWEMRTKKDRIAAVRARLAAMGEG